MKIGLLGCGNIASILAKRLQEEDLGYEITKVFDYDIEKAHKFQKKISSEIEVGSSIDALLEDTDIVIEAASPQAVKEHGVKILESGKDMISMSVGALADDLLYKRLQAAAEENNSQVHIPSGAIGGLDALLAANQDQLEHVVLVSVKPPGSLDLSEIENRMVVYEGNAREAIQEYPLNVNVSVAISLVVGFDKVRVKIVADPEADENTHEIYAYGKFGELFMELVNKPSPDNPKTSYIAALSIIATLKKQKNSIKIGT